MLPQVSDSDKPTAEVRLLADAMLGKLAKWLRLLGYDTAYNPAWDDAEIVRVARAEGRVVATSDRGLAGRRGIRTLLITSVQLQEQMTQVMTELSLPPAEAGSRCSVCNSVLEPVAKSDLARRVPKYVYDTQEVFRRCPNCDRIYWPGGHWARMQPAMSSFRSAVEQLRRDADTERESELGNQDARHQS